MKRAIGWLGWTEEQALKSTIEAIVLGWEGRCEMINAVFGGGASHQSAAPDVNQRQFDVGVFDALFGDRDQ